MEWKTISLTFLSLGVELNLLWNIDTHCIVESVGLPSLCHCVVDVGPVPVSDDGYNGDYQDQLLSRDVNIQNIWAIKIQWVKLKEFLNGDAFVNDDDDFTSVGNFFSPQWFKIFASMVQIFLPQWVKNFISLVQQFYLNGSKNLPKWFKNFTSLVQKFYLNGSNSMSSYGASPSQIQSAKYFPTPPPWTGKRFVFL